MGGWYPATAARNAVSAADGPGRPSTISVVGRPDSGFALAFDTA